MTRAVLDRRVWLLTCGRCGDRVTLRWPDHDGLDPTRWQRYTDDWSAVHDRAGRVTIAAATPDTPAVWPHGLRIAGCRP